MTPLLSIITGTRNRPEAFRRLVNSIEEHAQVDWELVVGDASDVPIDTMGLPAHVQVFEERPRLGYSVGYNRLCAKARGTWVLMLNDDAEVLKGFDTEAIDFMVAHPQIGIGALHYSENDSAFHVNSAWSVVYANFPILRRSVGNDIGWFDPDVSFYGSDNVLVIRALLAGYGIADIPNARVLHHSVKDDCRRENQKNRLRDNETLTNKYMPLKRQWVATYNRLKVDTGTVPWSHGVEPGVMTAR